MVSTSKFLEELQEVNNKDNVQCPNCKGYSKPPFSECPLCDFQLVEPNDRHYTLCPECGFGTDDVTVSNFGMCMDCCNSEGEKHCTGCGDSFKGTADVCYACPEGDYCLHCGDELSADKYGEMYCHECDDDVEHCKGCDTDCTVNDDGLCEYCQAELDGEPIPVNCLLCNFLIGFCRKSRNRFDVLCTSCHNGKVIYELREENERLETRVRFLEDLPALKAEGLVE